MLNSARFAIRGLAKDPGYAAAFVLTLGLGIGASTAIFSAVEGVLIRPLPYPHAHRIAYVQHPQLRTGLENANFSFVEIADFRSQSATVEEFVEYGDWEFNVVGRGEPHLATGGLVTSNYFKVLGLRPYLGRMLTAADDVPGAPAVAVLTYEYWNRVFGADPDIVGRTLELTNIPITVVGVLEPGSHYAGSERAELYANYTTNAHYMSASMQNERSHRMTDVYALVKDGTPLEGARAELRAIARRLHASYPVDYPESMGYDVTMTPWRDVLTTNARPTLLILMAAVMLVLAVACANVGNLTLSRLVRRERELAVRAALGAKPSDLRRQLLVEHLLLALAGAGLGILVARGLLDALVSYAARFTLRADAVSLNATVLGFSIGLAAAAAILFAWAPRLTVYRSLTPALASGTGAGGSTGGPKRRIAQRLLVLGQVATSFVLLAGAGLLVRSFAAVQRVEPGFTTSDVLTLRAPNFTRRNVDQNRALFDDVSSRLASFPGVVSVATASRVPFSDATIYTWQLRADGGDEANGDRRSPVVFNSVSPAYFDTLGVEIVRGRALAGSDIANTERAIVINQWLAKYVFGDADPVGRRLQWSFDGRRWEDWRTIAGVARDVRETGSRGEVVPSVYEAAAQTSAGPGLLIRIKGDPGPVAREAERAIHEIDPKRPVVDVTMLDAALAERVSPWRLNATLFGAFAALALVIAAVGIGAVLAFAVSQRTRDFGIRMALGAERTQILTSVLREGAVLAGAGIVLGWAAAYAMSGLLSNLLFGVAPHDAATYAGVAALLLLACLAASVVPARRATQAEPVIALRTE
jgi:predicted permease